MIKKIIILLFVNIVIMSLGIVFFDFCYYKYSMGKLVKSNPEYEFMYSQPYSFNLQNFKEIYKNTNFRPVCVPKSSSNKRSIVIFGCSFVNNYFFSDEQSFCYKLSNASGRYVHDRANPGWSVQHMLYQLKHENFSNIKNPEYIIYVIIEDHYYRMITDFFWGGANDINLKYKQKNKKLIEHKFKDLFFNKLYIYKKLSVRYFHNYANKQIDKVSELMKAHINESYRLIKERFPNSKLVIIKYRINEYPNVYFDNSMWDILKNEGIIVLEANQLINDDLSKPEYCYSKTDSHPSEYALTVLAEKLTKELKL